MSCDIATAGQQNNSANWRVIGFISTEAAKINSLESHLSNPFGFQIEAGLWRIFFSYRDGTQRSLGSYIDLDISNDIKIVRSAGASVLRPGGPGLFDEYGAIPSSIIQVGDAHYLYYIGRTQGLRSPMWYASVGLAISRDGGLSFEKFSDAPIFTINQYDPCFVTAPFVVSDGGRYLMYYISCFKWEEINGKLASYYDVKLAVSDDAIHWTPTGKTMIPLRGQERNLGRPCIYQKNADWELWYCYAGEQKYRLGFATSTNGEDWQRKDELVETGLAETTYADEMQCYPFVFRDGDRKLMLANGNQFGREGFAVLELGR